MEVKDRIVNQINQILDESLLSELELIISGLQATEKNPYPLSEEMDQSLNLAEEGIKHKRVVNHNELMRETKKWMKERITPIVP